jgi:catechol 2,3-dioxygenase-like lactoylglutathione lyase family enzyme
MEERRIGMKIALTGVYVDSPAKAFAFYTQVLGFIERMYIPEAALAIVASPEEPGGTGLLLEPNDNPIARSYQEALYNAEMPAIVFGTADIDKEYQRLRELGVVFRKGPTKTDWGVEAVFEDTCGTSFSSRRSDERQATFVTCGRGSRTGLTANSAAPSRRSAPRASTSAWVPIKSVSGATASGARNAPTFIAVT